MKKYFIAVMLTVAFVFPALTIRAQAKTSSSRLVGTWQLLSAVYTTKDTTMQRDSSTIRQIKIITPKRFMSVTMQIGTDSVLAAATGKVIFEGNRYKEVVEHSNINEIAGKTYSYPVNLEGKIWFLRGTVEQWRIDEVWKKLD